MTPTDHIITKKQNQSSKNPWKSKGKSHENPWKTPNHIFTSLTFVLDHSNAYATISEQANVVVFKEAIHIRNKLNDGLLLLITFTTHPGTMLPLMDSIL
jgi:hypothetical protein